ncbi:MAG: hypothetical protein MHM6MM_002445 [Cercozoa sp. M6MM]
MEVLKESFWPNSQPEFCAVKRDYSQYEGTAVSSDELDRLCCPEELVPSVLELLADAETRVQQIDRVPASKMTVDRFNDEFDRRNVPVLLENATAGWKCMQCWTTDSQSGGRKVNVQYLSREYGTAKATLSNCSFQEWETTSVQEGVTVAKFLQSLDATEVEADVSRHFSVQEAVQEVYGAFQQHRSRAYYLRDLTLFRQCKSAMREFDLPAVFADDWFNAHCDREMLAEDYRFVYLGAKDSYTPMHHDVMRSHSWSSNVFGTKLWIMLPPCDKHLLMDSTNTHMISNLFHVDWPSVNTTVPRLQGDTQPHFLMAREALRRAVVFVQRAGDAVFVPSGWYHQVHNVGSITASINHNWVSRFCADLVFAHWYDALRFRVFPATYHRTAGNSSSVNNISYIGSLRG